jgi:hypothetical protein
MKKILIILFSLLFLNNFANSESRFGELTEMRDEKMRGKVGQWVRPHPGPFIWNHIESKKGDFFWEDVDQHVVYAQENNQTILATIWPYANWDQKSCKRKKVKSPFGKRFTKYLSKPCSMDDYKNFLIKLVDRYDGDGFNDMSGLTKPIKYWDVMNEPEFKMFFKGSKDDFIEIFNFSSKAIKEKQPEAIIVMAGAAGMFPKNKKYWKSVLPEIKDHFDIANIHHISGPDGQCDKELWVDEFAELLKSVNVDKPIWLTEAMTCGPPVKAWVNAFLNGAELIIDVGVNAPGKKMSKKSRKKLNEFIAEYDGFISIKPLSKDQVEFTYNDGSKKTLKF